ncbi:alkaline phosphatase family protein [Nocardia sp. NPDC059240]|uniref:alkaline phosphatase family protein n=1 Tax=Nocardia sp. NPDC059240 TaxID=3346786 RepID=UPI003693612F
MNRIRTFGRIQRSLAMAAAGMFVAALATAVGAGPAGAATSANLIVDPSGNDVAQCSPTGLDAMTVPGWVVRNGSAGVVCYGAAGGYPTHSTTGASGTDKGFFEGGGTGDSQLEQDVDVSAVASQIDGGSVPFTLSGWLGGYASQNDRVALKATFRNGSGAAIGTATQLGPVTASDRGNNTEFLHKTGTGKLPAGTRTVEVDLLFTYAAGDSIDGYAHDISLTVGANLPTPALVAPASQVPGFDHVFLVYMENENYENIIGNTAQAPYINGLRSQATTLSASYATTHPSDPNYVAFGAGALYGLTGNSILTTTIDAPHVGNRVEDAGKSWKAYVENQSGNCDTTAHGHYYPDDVPFWYFKNMKTNPSYCQAHWQPLPQMVSDLKSAATTPNFVWFAADGCDDMEDCGIAAGDTWLKNTLPAIFNSPAWTQQRSLLILTFDEGATKAYGPNYPNRVPTLLLGSTGTVKSNFTSSQRTDQYGLLRMTDRALGLKPLTANDSYAPTVNDAWATVPGTP